MRHDARCRKVADRLSSLVCCPDPARPFFRVGLCLLLAAVAILKANATGLCAAGHTMAADGICTSEPSNVTKRRIGSDSSGSLQTDPLAAWSFSQSGAGYIFKPGTTVPVSGKTSAIPANTRCSGKNLPPTTVGNPMVLAWSSRSLRL